MDTKLKFRRDATSKALLNNNQEELAGYKLQRKKLQKVSELEGDINTLKADMSELKMLLKDILTRGTK